MTPPAASSTSGWRGRRRSRRALSCHRTILVTPRLIARGLTVMHVLADGAIEPHSPATEDRLIAETFRREQPDMFRSRAEILAEAYLRREEAVAYRMPAAGKA
jgi:hypothetical protein